MKLATLFAKYLYQHKNLNLPGIGTFSIDPGLQIPEAADKSFAEFIQQIRYIQKPITSTDEEFINFIRTETGKIKPLAESDLDSFLTDGKILLNIGKPFHIEGIGSLLKTKTGVYEFTPGEPMLQKLEKFSTDSPEEGNKKRSVYTTDPVQPASSRKLLIAAGVIGGIVLIIWGGYSLYNRNTPDQPAVAQDTITIAPADTSRANIILDSVQKIIDSSFVKDVPQKGTYKFVIEKTMNKGRALRRYSQLKDNFTDIKMESPDSILFKLYFVLPALPSDTARIKDSLRLWYGRRQVFVE